MENEEEGGVLSFLNSLIDDISIPVEVRAQYQQLATKLEGYYKYETNPFLRLSYTLSTLHTALALNPGLF